MKIRLKRANSLAYGKVYQASKEQANGVCLKYTKRKISRKSITILVRTLVMTESLKNFFRKKIKIKDNKQIKQTFKPEPTFSLQGFVAQLYKKIH